MSFEKKVIIAGAGASGLCAAIAAARDGALVTVIEKTDSCGKKLSMTGNGRCNLANLNLSSDDYNSESRGRMKNWLKRFGVKEATDFFTSLGLVIISENGYLYPISGQANSVVSVLVNECKRLGVEFCFNEQVKEVIKEDDGTFTVRTSTDSHCGDAVILSMGGLAGPKTTGSTGDGYYICEKLGMSKKDTYPALVALNAEDDTLPKDSGVRALANVTFYIGDEVIAAEYGEVQITSKGISGIPVMQASGVVAGHLSKGRPVTASINFFPGYNDDEFDNLVKTMLELPGERKLGELLDGFCNSNINEMILKRMKISAGMKIRNVGASMVSCILYKYRNLRIEISGTGDYKKAQVTKGGISLGDLDDTMQSKSVPGVFVVGELCDVDGRCGGYNLQWAWTSGYIAGEAASCL
ncbi:aminoacetone oxidase family FAD-binding enzyme [Butyrivibrio sp. AC2005]|uniref:aminoacetone oxidase family FAD-binding enzyme n=1 Tax=Butyrivibrio sp. AC2005 TaxID=1280672 RepID=UPI00041C1F57|nr:aminoacetone oxidase family FAD-binding enzyme [Butyrivibrio sp. AC2005]